MIEVRDPRKYEIGIYLKVTDKGSLTAYDVVSEHMKVARRNPAGYVWWGNNQPFSPDKLEEFRSWGHNPKALLVIPHTCNGSDNIEFIADIGHTARYPNKDFPPDDYRPSYYFDQPHKTWLQLLNIRRVSRIDGYDIADYRLISNGDPLIAKLNSQYACGYVYRLRLDSSFFDEPDDLCYQQEVCVANPTTIAERPQSIPQVVRRSEASIWLRDPRIAKKALEKASYLCEYDSSHTTFISSTTGRNYVEAHHLIPMRFQQHFNYSLDVPGNIVALCPNCHRAIHYSDLHHKEEMLKLLYRKKANELQLYGIAISLQDLIDFYCK